MTEDSRKSISSFKHEESGSSNLEKVVYPTMDFDEEKTIGLDGDARERDTERRGRNHSRSQDSHSLRTTRSHQSRAGGDGYTCFDAEPEHARPNSKPGVVTEQPYLVTWDGDSDPLNPRSMTKLRRWAIVLICSASSLCV